MSQLEQRLKPISELNETIGLYKKNLNLTYDKINQTCTELVQAEEANKKLQTAESLEPSILAHWMSIALQLSLAPTIQ